MTDLAELKEKVVAAIRDAWNDASLEEAAKLCDYYAERHIDPMNFAKECAADIRALISKATAQADAKEEK